MENILNYLRELNIVSMMVRVLCAMLFGGIIGFEREKKGRPAGFRTYMLVAMGSAIAVILSQYLSVMLHTQWASSIDELGAKVDASRIASKVVNGVGFLSAGTILVTSRHEIKGLTTAAGLWSSACMGIAIGAGFYECMIVGVALIFISMKILPYVEELIISRARNMNIYIELDSIENFGNVVNRVKAEGMRLYDVDIKKERQETSLSQFRVELSVYLPKRMHHTEVLAMLSALEGLTAIEEV